MRRSTLVVVVVVVALLLSGAATAGVLTPTSKRVASGTATVTACGSLGSAVPSYTVTAGNVTKVVVTSLPSACNGAALNLTLAGSAGADLGGGGPVTIAGQSATFTSLTATPSAALVASIRLVASGP